MTKTSPKSHTRIHPRHKCSDDPLLDLLLGPQLQEVETQSFQNMRMYIVENKTKTQAKFNIKNLIAMTALLLPTVDSPGMQTSVAPGKKNGSISMHTTAGKAQLIQLI